MIIKSVQFLFVPLNNPLISISFTLENCDSLKDITKKCYEGVKMEGCIS